MKKRVSNIIILILLIVFLLFLLFSAFLGIQVVNGSTQLVTPDDTKGASDEFWSDYGLDYDEFCNTYKIEKIELESTFDGHIIPADYIYAQNSGRDNKTVILVHGLGGNRLKNYPVAEMFLKKGFNVLTYDQRSSNENKAEHTTFGYWEKYDLIDCIDFVRSNQKDKTLGVWGTSFGGATAGLAIGYKDTQQKVDFLIMDCPVSNMRWMVENEIKKMNTGIPVGYITVCGDFANQVMLGFSYKEADVAYSMKKIEIPVLIINSKADTMTPYFMGKAIYDSVKSTDKTIWTVTDSEHTEMWLEHNQEYRNEVFKLLDMVN